MRSTQTVSGLFLAIMFAGTPLMRAEETPLVSADLGYASKYVFRGIEKAGASAQAELEFSKDNLSASLGTNQSFALHDESEVNLGAAYSHEMGQGQTLEVSAKNYRFTGGPAGDTRHSFEAGITATLAPIQGVTPSLAYYHDFRLRSDTAQAALAYSIALTSLGTFLDLNVSFGSSTGDNWRPDTPGPHRQDSYSYWGAEIRLPYNIGYLVPHTTVVTGLYYADTHGLSPVNGPFSRSSGQNFWVTLGVNLDF